jgi:serine/threonine protein kinase/Tol biopolymer transport system component
VADEDMNGGMEPERWRRLEALYHEAVARPAMERARFLAEACGDDAALRRDVETLLASAGSTSEIVHGLAATAAQLVGGIGASVMTGRQIGVYQLGDLLGAGGMGEVYRARDTRLNRDVAVKILPRLFTTDSERLARFDREAQLLAALNHPHICAIYAVEDTPDSSRALVLELVDGPTLADRIAKGPLPVQEALTIAMQVADALAAAHQRGIVHRDLKPANIKITAAGQVKVLDFGLAKLAGDIEASQADTRAPTVTSGVSREGALLGTAAYMSPEQARGQAVDKRTDVWSFGCVLYEMLTGRSPFAGITVSDALTAILEHEPDWRLLPASTPSSIRALLQRCLQKDRDRRQTDLADAHAEIADTLNPRYALGRRAGIAAAAITSAAIAVAVWFIVSRSAPPVTSASEYVQLTDFTDAAMTPSVSPDGRLVAFKRGTEPFLGPGQIYVKVLPNGDAIRLTDSPRMKYGPVFTPDGSRIAYTELTGEGTSVSWDTWTVPVSGGPPTRLLPNASGLTWLSPRHVLFSEITSGLHMQVVAATESRADSRVVYSPDLEMGMAHYSYASPDLRSALIVEMGKSHTFDSPCRLVSLEGGASGQPVGPAGLCYSAAWSRDGTWMYFAANNGGHTHLWRQKYPNGVAEQITFGVNEEAGIAVTPDGRSLITSVGRRVSAIWLHDTDGDRQLTSEGSAAKAQWSTDGSHVFFLDSSVLAALGPGVGSEPPGELRAVNIGSGSIERVLLDAPVTDFDVSRDRRDIVFTRLDRGESQVWLAPLDRSSSPRELTRSADEVSFGARGEVIFRLIAKNTNFLYRINRDGSGREAIVSLPIIQKGSVSPDGEWVAAVVATSKKANESTNTLAVPYDTMAISVHSGQMIKLCNGACRVSWSLDGRFLQVGWSFSQTMVLPIPAGRSLPNLPASGISVGDEPNDVPGARILGEEGVAIASDSSTYLFTKSELHANLYRIPLH